MVEFHGGRAGDETARAEEGEGAHEAVLGAAGGSCFVDKDGLIGVEFIFLLEVVVTSGLIGPSFHRNRYKLNAIKSSVLRSDDKYTRLSSERDNKVNERSISGDHSRYFLFNDNGNDNGSDNGNDNGKIMILMKAVHYDGHTPNYTSL